MRQEPDLLRELVSVMAGAAGEKLEFGCLSTGVHDDLHAATALARAMVTAFGMSDELGPGDDRREAGGGVPRQLAPGPRPDRAGHAEPHRPRGRAARRRVARPRGDGAAGQLARRRRDWPRRCSSTRPCPGWRWTRCSRRSTRCRWPATTQPPPPELARHGCAAPGPLSRGCCRGLRGTDRRPRSWRPPGSASRRRPRCWRLEQPPPPAGAPFKVALGAPGDLSFRAPNRGLLAVEGNAADPARAVHLGRPRVVAARRRLRRVGVHDPDRLGRAVGVLGRSARRAGRASATGSTLCHFKDGQVVASYGTQPNAADPYQVMTAATCAGPDDCWFGGGAATDPTGARAGAFRLHWDGQRADDELRAAGARDQRPRRVRRPRLAELLHGPRAGKPDARREPRPGERPAAALGPRRGRRVRDRPVHARRDPRRARRRQRAARAGRRRRRAVGRRRRHRVRPVRARGGHRRRVRRSSSAAAPARVRGRRSRRSPRPGRSAPATGSPMSRRSRGPATAWATLQAYADRSSVNAPRARRAHRRGDRRRDRRPPPGVRGRARVGRADRLPVRGPVLDGDARRLAVPLVRRRAARRRRRPGVRVAHHLPARTSPPRSSFRTARRSTTRCCWRRRPSRSSRRRPRRRPASSASSPWCRTSAGPGCAARRSSCAFASPARARVSLVARRRRPGRGAHTAAAVREGPRHVAAAPEPAALADGAEVRDPRPGAVAVDGWRIRSDRHDR